jgi:hypothetical protein
MLPVAFAGNFRWTADSAAWCPKMRMHDFETIDARLSKLIVHHGGELGRGALQKAATNQ